MSKTVKKKKKQFSYGRYATGADVYGTAGAFGGQLLGTIAGQDTGVGSFLSGAGSGVGTGAAIGSIVPGVGTAIGALAGGVIGGIGGLIGKSKKDKEAERLRKQQQVAFDQSYLNQYKSQADTNNQNPYGNQLYQDGGIVNPSNIINIEKNELQIDPQSGKILREYTGINPETGGLYEAHNTKGQDTNNNMVTAEPNTFIITKAKSKEYKKAVDENDKLKQNTILQNIRNYKSSITPNSKFATGGDLKPLEGVGINQVPFGVLPTINPLGVSNSPQSTSTAKSSVLNNVLGQVANYGPSLLNIGQGLFGKVEQQPYGAKITNPYLSQTLNNLPQDISFEPIRRDVLRQQRSTFDRINNSTSSSAIARANKNALLGSTQNTLAKLKLDNQLANNQIRSQRGSIYNQLGQQDMQEQARLQNYNLGIDQINSANRAAKTNLLNTGLGQLQQTLFNSRATKAKQASEDQQLNLLAQIFPNILNSDYSGLFTR